MQNCVLVFLLTLAVDSLRDLAEDPENDPFDPDGYWAKFDKEHFGDDGRGSSAAGQNAQKGASSIPDTWEDNDVLEPGDEDPFDPDGYWAKYDAEHFPDDQEKKSGGVKNMHPKTHPATSQVTSGSSCALPSARHCKKVLQLLQTAREYTSAGVRLARRSCAEITRWFGSCSGPQKHVVDSLVLAEKILGGTYIVPAQKVCYSVSAYVRPGSKYKGKPAIFLCENFFDRDDFYNVKTLVHEATHHGDRGTAISRSYDVEKGTRASLCLAHGTGEWRTCRTTRFPPHKNAESLAYYVMEANGKTFGDIGRMPPIKCNGASYHATCREISKLSCIGSVKCYEKDTDKVWPGFQ